MSEQRKYSVSEIGRMRRAIAGIIKIGGATDEARAAIHEEHLRTYMMNGTAPEELEAAAESAYLAEVERLAAAHGRPFWVGGAIAHYRSYKGRL